MDASVLSPTKRLMDLVVERHELGGEATRSQQERNRVFDARVRDAVGMLRDGKTREDVRVKHGGIVLRAAYLYGVRIPTTECM